MTGCDLMEELARLKEDRDRLIDEAKALMRERDDARKWAKKYRAEAAQLKDENIELAQDITRTNEALDYAREKAKKYFTERDDAREYADCEKQFADELEAERDHARKCAEEMRDLYAAEIDESIAAFPFSWEDEHGADRDGC